MDSPNPIEYIKTINHIRADNIDMCNIRYHWKDSIVTQICEYPYQLSCLNVGKNIIMKAKETTAETFPEIYIEGDKLVYKSNNYIRVIYDDYKSHKKEISDFVLSIQTAVNNITDYLYNVYLEYLSGSLQFDILSQYNSRGWIDGLNNQFVYDIFGNLTHCNPKFNKDDSELYEYAKTIFNPFKEFIFICDGVPVYRMGNRISSNYQENTNNIKRSLYKRPTISDSSISKEIDKQVSIFEETEINQNYMLQYFEYLYLSYTYNVRFKSAKSARF